MVAAVLAGAVGGWRIGLVTRLLSWVGLALGLVAAVRLLPVVLDAFGATDPLLEFVSAAGLLLGLGLGGQAIGLAVGARLRPRTDDGDVPAPDRVAGMLAGAVGVILLVWLLAPVAVNGPEPLASVAQRSRTVALLDDWLPPPPDALAALQSIAGPDFPQVFAALEPDLELDPPPGDAGLTPDAERAAARATVKVRGPACYRIQTGTGFVAGPELVLTNAHVVAGMAEPSVERDDGTDLAADVVLFDPDTDVALLRVPGLAREPLAVSDAAVGDTGGVFGHPLGQPLRVAPFSIERAVRATGTDIYDADTVTRDVLVLAATLAQGDSGAPLVAPSGEVVGMAFAIAPDRDGVAYALPGQRLTEVLAAPVAAGTSTGACT